MNEKKFLMLFAIALVLIATSTIVFAESDIKTHEYNFLNNAVFNISDELTNETELNTSQSDSLEVGTFYTYPDGKVICSLWFVSEDGSTDFEGHQEDSSYEKIEGNKTSQGYRTYIFKNTDECDVFIDLNNLTLDDGGSEMNYCYFRGTFETLNEAQMFIDTFRINETS